MMRVALDTKQNLTDTGHDVMGGLVGRNSVIHSIAYDLHQPNDKADDYERVIGALKKKFPTWCHLEESVWLVDTTLTAGEARDFMNTCISDKDTVFVARLSGNWASQRLSKEQVEWLNARNF